MSSDGNDEILEPSYTAQKTLSSMQLELFH